MGKQVSTGGGDELSTYNHARDLELIRQYFEHFRHEENHRATFTGFYAVIAAAVLAFFAQASDFNQRPLLMVLLALSGLGSVLTFRTWRNLEALRRRLQNLAGDDIPLGAKFFLFSRGAGLINCLKWLFMCSFPFIGNLFRHTTQWQHWILMMYLSATGLFAYSFSVGYVPGTSNNDTVSEENKAIVQHFFE